MIRKPVLYLSILLLVLAAGCSRYVLRGQILDIKGNDVVLSVGNKDGATVGQQLTVFNYKAVPWDQKIQAINDEFTSGVSYKKEATGLVQITGVTGDHYSTGKVVNGTAVKHNTVVLAK